MHPSASPAQPAAEDARDLAASTTFVPNQKLPIHRWFRYSAGYSGAWAEAEIRRSPLSDGCVLDPFAGVGTTLVAAQQVGVRSIGIEAHPLVRRIAQIKLNRQADPAAFQRVAARVLAGARESRQVFPEAPALLRKIYDPGALATLQRMSRVLASISDEPESATERAWLAILAILRVCSGAGTAPWQYVLPNKRKARVRDPYAAFAAQVQMMVDDLEAVRVDRPEAAPATLLAGDAREMKGVGSDSVSLVLTSPPYPNNYDYADATRIELTFLGEVERWADLHAAVRHRLLVSCSQHARTEKLALDALLADPVVQPIQAELTQVCRALQRLRGERRGKKHYDAMVAAYFGAMGRCVAQIARVLREGGQACLVIGDSAPYGVYVPVDAWLGALARAEGLTVLRFEPTRERNRKWKNRKHRVPLKEGRLWLKKNGDPAR